MKIRLGFVTGFASGYYLGARAGRQRYDQINRAVRKLRQSQAFGAVVEKARTAVGRGANGQVDSGLTVAFVENDVLP
ncbi:MAG: hypothetical protein ACRD0Q_04440 [Acidimicrobiales bacterium]